MQLTAGHSRPTKVKHPKLKYIQSIVLVLLYYILYIIYYQAILGRTNTCFNPKRPKWSPKGCPRDPQETKLEPRGSQGTPEGPNWSPKGSPGDPPGRPFWILVDFDNPHFFASVFWGPLLRFFVPPGGVPKIWGTPSGQKRQSGRKKH